MNLKNIVLTVAVLHVAIGAAALTAQARPNRANFPQQVPSEPANRPRETFSGTVWQNGGKFVLRDELHKVWYQLDDQRWAARFEGKEVRVTGTLDAARKAIHVQDIEEDPVQSQ
jgi:Protein of unknown function (DUF5818)